MKEKVVIKNSFFDLIAFLISFIFSFFRSIKLFFISNSKSKNNIFFDFLDFIFRDWSKYFWKRPSVFKITSFFSDTLKYIFKNK